MEDVQTSTLPSTAKPNDVRLMGVKLFYSSSKTAPGPEYTPSFNLCCRPEGTLKVDVIKRRKPRREKENGGGRERGRERFGKTKLKNCVISLFSSR
ncbi:hypothetical protein BT69DRAFT_1154845 [Atractiella rhizophila]|nr:hypothetical protein BT69DRAFT_1154845 [Atractiella rhizophila]